MTKYKVAIGHFKEKIKSVEEVLNLSQAFNSLMGGEKVFLKPNIVYWAKDPSFSKYGVVTTSRVVEDVIIYLNNLGVKDITIGEGIVTTKVNDFETTRNAYEYLGYNRLKKKYGINSINIFERPFKKIDLGDNIELMYNLDAMESDLIVSVPVLKTHSQTKISLAIKNLKGLIDVNSRKKCHSPDLENDLEFYISHLSDSLPQCATVIDGIYSNERGPGPDGRARRSDILVASSDIFSADKVGSKILGFDPSEVKYLNYYANKHQRPVDFSDIDIVGTNIEDVQMTLEYKFPYTEDGLLPLAYAKQGIKGISFRQYDNSLCTYCTSLVSSAVQTIPLAWNGDPFEDVEFILGKRMNPTPGKKKTVLLGQCMVNKHRNNPDINQAIPIKGCPVKIENIKNGLLEAGFDINPEFFDNIDSIHVLTARAYRHYYKQFSEYFFNDEIPIDTVPPIDTVNASRIVLYKEDDKFNKIHFEIKFYGIIGEKGLDLVKDIIISGPNGYKIQIKKQKFDFTNANGFIVDGLNKNIVRFLVHEENNELLDGKYEFKVEYFDGQITTRVTTLNTNKKFFKKYDKIKEKLSFTFNPKLITNGQTRIMGDIRWDTIKKHGGIDAYYINYISERKGKFVDLHDLIFMDDIFSMSIVMPSYGLNKQQAFFNPRKKPLKPGTEYAWMTEICDSNDFEKVNSRIFQSTQFFKVLEEN
ncbi:MAG: DUF362 domain-containing protein [Candidatus Lokiarchaeota archaeon]|nr:DUF362 domain-containing protein [Candidatus Lokiarchaeota archaeon]